MARRVVYVHLVTRPKKIHGENFREKPNYHKHQEPSKKSAIIYGRRRNLASEVMSPHNLTISQAVSVRQRPTVTSAPLTAEQKKKKKALREQRQFEIDQECHLFFSQAAAKAEELSQRFGKKPRYFLDLFFQGGAKMITVRPKGNAWNAFIAREAESNKENEGTIIS